MLEELHRVSICVYVCGCVLQFVHMRRYMNTCEQLQCARIYGTQASKSLCISTFAPVRTCVCVLVCVAGPMCTTGWPGKTCLSVCGTSLASLSPQGPQLCPEAGRLRGGTSSQGGPQAVSVHYCYRDGTWPAGGQTFSPYLL